MNKPESTIATNWEHGLSVPVGQVMSFEFFSVGPKDFEEGQGSMKGVPGFDLLNLLIFYLLLLLLCMYDLDYILLITAITLVP